MCAPMTWREWPMRRLSCRMSDVAWCFAGAGCFAHQKCVRVRYAQCCRARPVPSSAWTCVARSCCFGLPCGSAVLPVRRLGCEADPEGLQLECAHCMRWCRARLASPFDELGAARGCLCVVATPRRMCANCRATATCCAG